jgi:hypothetical protein
VPASALDLGELGHELAAVDLAGDSLTLRVKAQPFVQILNVGLDLYRLIEDTSLNGKLCMFAETKPHFFRYLD